MKLPRLIQSLIFATCATGPFLAPVAHAQTSPPWWQQIIKQTTQKAENSVLHGIAGQNTGTTTSGNSTTSVTNTPSAGAPIVSSMSPSALLPFVKQTIVFRGSGFGTLEPFNGHFCALQFVDITENNNFIGGIANEYVNPQSGLPFGASDGTFYVTKWTDSEVIIKGIYGGSNGSIATFRPGDLVRIEIANPQKFDEYPNHGLCGSPAARLFTHVASSLPGPQISTFSDGVTQTPVSAGSAAAVSTILPVAKQTITISGSGFGTHAPFRGDSRFLQIRDITENNWTSEASCANGCATGPSVDVRSWTDNQIVLGGFVNGYGGADVLHPGDIVRISIANPQLAGDMGSVNSVFGGSPPTRIFVTVANPSQATPAATPMMPPATSAATTTGAGMSVTQITAEANPPALLTGDNFGTFPQPLPFTRDSPYLRVQDITQHWEAGYIAPKNWLGDACTVSISSWTNTAIAFTLNVNSTIGGALPTSVCSLHAGDTLKITAINPQTQQSAQTTTVVSQSTALSQSTTAGATPLVLLFTSTSGSYVAFSQQELLGLISNVTSVLQADHVPTTTMKVIVSVVPSTTINTSTVNALTKLIDLPTTAAKGFQYAEALGSVGIAFFTSQEALQYYLNKPTLPPALVAGVANNIISDDAARVSTTQNDLSPESPTCTGYVPEYVFGPGESLEVVFTGLTTQPNGNSTAQVAYRYRLMDKGGVISGLGAPLCAQESGPSNDLQFQSNASAVSAR